MLIIQNLSISVSQKNIVQDVNLAIKPGSVHALMGPNGSGKSTLAYTLMGYPTYEVAQGSLMLEGVSLNELSIDKRAKAGIFLAFQQPLEIPGVTVFNFLREAYHALGNPLLSISGFQELVYAKMALLQMDVAFAQRPVNAGFSGGEKKRLELLQLLVLKPKIAILDEIDSGLDVDALKIVAQGLQKAREDNPNLALLMITHYPRLFNYIKPDFVHVLSKGRLIKSGEAELAFAIEQRGYNAVGA
jgi:Fe-S cluster assembly ATP-binding protein